MKLLIVERAENLFIGQGSTVWIGGEPMFINDAMMYTTDVTGGGGVFIGIDADERDLSAVHKSQPSSIEVLCLRSESHDVDSVIDRDGIILIFTWVSNGARAKSSLGLEFTDNLDP